MLHLNYIVNVKCVIMYKTVSICNLCTWALINLLCFCMTKKVIDPRPYNLLNGILISTMDISNTF